MGWPEGSCGDTLESPSLPFIVISLVWAEPEVTDVFISDTVVASTHMRTRSSAHPEMPRHVCIHTDRTGKKRRFWFRQSISPTASNLLLMIRQVAAQGGSSLTTGS